MTKQPTTFGSFSVSLAVKDLPASRAFYEKLAFEFTDAREHQRLLKAQGTATRSWSTSTSRNTGSAMWVGQQRSV